MGKTTLSNVRILLCIKPESEWEKIKDNQNKILMQGEIGINSTTGQFKIGTGIVDEMHPENSGTWANLPYVNIGSNYEEKITLMVKNMITAPSNQTETKEIYDMLVNLIKDNAVTDLSGLEIAEGGNNGTIKWRTSPDEAFTEVVVKGLGTAAMKNIGTAAEDVPTIGTTLSGKNGYPVLADSNGKLQPGTSAMGDMAYKSSEDYMNKTQFEEEITKKMKANDAMVFKGTIDDLSKIPTSNVKVGDTYKITKQLKDSAWTSLMEVGDMIVALNSSVEGETFAANTTNWSYVPSGNESTISTDILVEGSNTLILDGNFS